MKKILILSLMAALAIAMPGCESSHPAEADANVNGTGDATGQDAWTNGQNSEATNEEGLAENTRFDTSGGKGKRGMFAPIHFAFDSANVQSKDHGTLQHVASYLRNNPNAKIVIEGNTDNRGTAEYNRSLGQRRAQAAREVLAREGVSPERLSTVSYGEDKPASSGNSESAWAQNRRDEFVVVP
ncbi:MAG: peptidoglycan-associated lipoprotein Pal [Verrucomicrobiae bacterium]|nr:peptidoglycan-associated lipoprotein Pal [Verrucomicrobiae bacterium]